MRLLLAAAIPLVIVQSQSIRFLTPSEVQTNIIHSDHGFDWWLGLQHFWLHLGCDDTTPVFPFQVWRKTSGCEQVQYDRSSRPQDERIWRRGRHDIACLGLEQNFGVFGEWMRFGHEDKMWNLIVGVSTWPWRRVCYAARSQTLLRVVSFVCLAACCRSALLLLRGCLRKGSYKLLDNPITLNTKSYSNCRCQPRIYIHPIRGQFLTTI